jgi:hypothetical protein
VKQILIVLLVVLSFSLSGCSGEVSYEQIGIDEVPEKIRRSIEETPPGSTGMAEIGDEAYAVITGEAGEEIEIISVEKASVGIDVHYRIKKSSKSKSERPIKVVKLVNNGSPVGFKKVN